VDQAATLAQLPDRPCITQHLNIHGFHSSAKQFGPMAVYGSDAYELQKLILHDASLGEPLHPALPYIKAEVIWAVRQEMARTVEDVLARRTRALILNARAALAIAPAIADMIAPELNWNEATKELQVSSFQKVAANYILR
jgi:glycerol-3-phosphate dehydrogenase